MIKKTTEIWDNPRFVPKFYRYDGYTNPSLAIFRVIDETPKGYWIAEELDGYVIGKKKFIYKRRRRPKYHPTIDEARKSYLHRKKAQLYHLKNDIYKVENTIAVIEKLWYDKKPKVKPEKEELLIGRGLEGLTSNPSQRYIGSTSTSSNTTSYNLTEPYNSTYMIFG